LRKGIILYLKKDFDQAIVAFTTVLELQPKEKVAYLYRGLSYYGENEFKDAYKDLHQARKLGQKVDDKLLRRLEIQIN